MSLVSSSGTKMRGQKCCCIAILLVTWLWRWLKGFNHQAPFVALTFFILLLRHYTLDSFDTNWHLLVNLRDNDKLCASWCERSLAWVFCLFWTHSHLSKRDKYISVAQIAKSLPRVCFLSGLSGEETMMFIDAFEETGISISFFLQMSSYVLDFIILLHINRNQKSLKILKFHPSVTSFSKKLIKGKVRDKKKGAAGVPNVILFST